MATIGYATLQIIPSLKGVTEAIERQVDGKVVNVTIEPKVDQRAADRAGKQAKETVEKQTKQVSVEPKVDQNAAKKAGKQAGEAVTKEVNDAVRKGDIGKTVGDEIKSSAKSSAGKEAAKAIVDGIADGVKQELPRGGVGEAIVDGIADGVKQGIDGVGIGGQVVDTISGGIRSGDLGGAIRDAVIPAINGIGDEIRSSASTWAGGIADSLRSGDIQGATTDIGTAVQNTTNLIADIGTTFGLQLEGVRDFGTNAATVLSDFGGDIQDVVNTASGIKGTFNEVGTLLETVLPGKAGRGAAKISAALASITMPAAVAAFLIYEGGKIGGDNLQAAIDAVGPDSEAGKNMINQATAPGMGVPGASRDPMFQATPDPLVIFGDQGAPLNAQRQRRGYSSGGYTGSMPFDKIAGVVHGGEYVIKASSTAGIENAFPGLLDYLNSKGTLPGLAGGGSVGGDPDSTSLLPGHRALVRAQELTGTGIYSDMAQKWGWWWANGDPNAPGQFNPDILLDLSNVSAFANGGKVALGNISGPGITTAEQQSMWDAVRGNFPDAILSSATRTVMTEGHPDFHNAGRAIDISGPGMGRIASWIASTYPDSLELIHSPFGNNIKKGKNVGDGMSFYGAGLMAAHRDHVHWALGRIAKPATRQAEVPSSSDMLSMIGMGVDVGSSPAVAPTPTTAAAESSGQSSGNSMKLSAPSSLAGFGDWAGRFGGEQIGSAITGASGGTLDPRLKTAVGGLGDLGSAAGSLIDGQVSSVLGAFGVDGSPGWLKGLSTFVGGMSIGGGGGMFGGDGASAPAAMSAAPRSAAAAIGSVHTGGAQRPGPTVNYNIRTATVEDSFLQAQRREKEMAAAKLARF